MLCQIGKILRADAPRRIEDDRQMFAGRLRDPYTMPNIRLEQGRLIREQTFFPECGHRELELVHGQSENVARLPVVAYDQRADMGLPASRKVGSKFLPHLGNLLRQNLETGER